MISFRNLIGPPRGTINILNKNSSNDAIGVDVCDNKCIRFTDLSLSHIGSIASNMQISSGFHEKSEKCTKPNFNYFYSIESLGGNPAWRAARNGIL